MCWGGLQGLAALRGRLCLSSAPADRQACCAVASCFVVPAHAQSSTEPPPTRAKTTDFPKTVALKTLPHFYFTSKSHPIASLVALCTVCTGLISGRVNPGA